MTPVDAELSVVSLLGVYTRNYTKTQGLANSVPTWEHLEPPTTVFDSQALTLATPAGKNCHPCPRSGTQMLQTPCLARSQRKAS